MIPALPTLINLAIMALASTTKALAIEPSQVDAALFDGVTWLLSIGSVLYFGIFVVFFLLDFFFTHGTRFFASKFRHHYQYNRTGFVFDTADNTGVPFAIITIEGENDQGAPINKTCVSDAEGIYPSISVPRGTYTVSVSRQGYRFPSAQTRTRYLPEEEFYQGTPIIIARSGQLIDPIIPMDRLSGSEDTPTAGRSLELLIWKKWQGLRRLQKPSEYFMLVLSLIGLFVHPRPIYLLAATFYTAMVLYRLYGYLSKLTLAGRVEDDHGEPVSGAIVEIAREGGQAERETITVSDHKGRYQAHLSPGKYLLHATKNGFISANQARAVNMDELVTLKDHDAHVNLKLMHTPTITEDFFFSS